MDSKEIARERILSLIDKNESSAISAEAKFKLKPNTVPRWRNGSLSTFMNILPEIAKAYGVTTDWLLGNEPEHTVPDMVRVPLVGVIQAGYPVESFENVMGYVKIPDDGNYHKNMFALDVIGDSMSPVVLDGDRIIVEKTDPSLCNGKICVVTVDNESTLKKIRIDRTGITLIPFNPLYKEIHYSPKEIQRKNLTIDGVLIKLIREF